MATLNDEPVIVPGVDEIPMTINPGDIWPLPYRGSRYTFKKIGTTIKMCWSRMDNIYCSDSIPNGLIRAMIEYKRDSRGSFRVTPHGEVITKPLIGDSIGLPVYLGKMEGLYSFHGFDLDPTGIETGRLWPGLHFKHGEEFAVWNRTGNDNYLYWTRKGIYFRSLEKYPELCAKVREIRPPCGRVYFTEFGHVWMNLHGGEVSFEWASKIKELIQEDKKMLAKNDVLLRSIVSRKSATGTYPIYLGRISDFDSGTAPRTHFTGNAKFGLGGEDIDDEDAFNSDSWKRMQRD